MPGPVPSAGKRSSTSLRVLPLVRLPAREAAAAPDVITPIREADPLGAIRRRETRYRRLLALADVLAAAFALVLCTSVLGDDHPRTALLLALPLVVVASKLTGLYDRDDKLLRKSTLDELPAHFQLATLYTLLVWLTSGALVEGRLGQEQVVVLWFSLFASMSAFRLGARHLAGLGALVERCLVLGDAEVADRLRRKVAGELPVEVVGHVPLEHATTDLQELRLVAAQADVHRLVIAPSEHTPNDRVLDVIRTAKETGMRVSLVPNMLEVVGSAVSFDDVHGMTLLGLPRYGLTASSRVLKRTFDVVVSATGLLVLWPAIAVAAVRIKRDSPGPAFYRQTRIGRDGRAFTMLKLRTMVDGADALKDDLRARNEAGDGLFKIADDPRITPVGHVLRRTHLDELPQLVNVLRGEMSLVGPRPLVADEDARITGLDRRRLQLTPGCTGPWQVLGPSRVPADEMVKLDHLYVAEWSLFGDLKLLLRTTGVFARRRGL